MQSPELPRITGDRCVCALVALGWIPERWSERSVELRRDPLQFHGTPYLTVPRGGALEPDALAAILRSAGLTPFRFVAALERETVSSFVHDDAQTLPPRSSR